jgi:anaerobic magnesium-protoporphyrin IX monomethyl ester cyclase
MPTDGEYHDWTTNKKFVVDKVNKFMPLGILSLATNIPEGHEVVILDPASYGWTIDETIQRIELEKPDILGLSVTNKRCYAMTQILAKTTCSYKCVGNAHTTYHSQEILDQGADVVFVGALADEEFNNAIINKPKGIVHCHTDINRIKFPARTLLNVEDYFAKSLVLFKADNRLPMFSSVGCLNRCTFCSVQSKTMHLKRAEEVVKEMKYLQSLGCNSVHILDDNFNINKKHLVQILDEMERQHFVGEWSARGQARMDYSLIPRMKALGFARVHVGIEALDNDILKFFNKPETVEDVNKFCKAMTDSGIGIVGYFILGSPVETEEYRNTLAQRIKDLGIEMPLFNQLFPEPDTVYYKSLNQNYWQEYFKNPTPDFVPPYPYGESRKVEMLDFADRISAEFK